MHLANTTTPLTGNTFSQQSIEALQLHTKAINAIKNNQSVMVAGVRHCLVAVAALKMIASQAEDNRRMVEAVYGTGLLNDIIDFVNKIKCHS